MTDANHEFPEKLTVTAVHGDATSPLHLNDHPAPGAIEHTTQWPEPSSLLKAIVDGVTDAIFVKDRDGRFQLFNWAAATFIGRPVEEILGKKAENLFGRAAEEKIRELELQVMESGNASTAEETLTAEGTERTFLTTRSPYRDEQGHIIGLIAVSRDITDTKRVEQELHKSQLRWRFALDSSGDGIWDWDMKTDQVYYSRQWKAMLGHGKDEIGNAVTEWSDRVHPDDLPRCWEVINNHFQGHTPDFVIEHRMRAKDGSWRWILDRGKVVERAEDGAPQRTIGTHTDITERKTADVELYLERERLALAAEAIRLGIWEYNLDANTILCDRRWHEIFGVDPASPVDTIEMFNRCVHPEDVERVTRERKTALANRMKIHRIEFRIQTPAGETRWIVSAARLIEANERTPNRLVGIVMDVTESRLAEETLQRSYEALRQAEKLAKIGSWTLDLKTSRFVSSDMLNEMIGLGPGDPPLTPDRLRDLLPPEGYERVRSGIERCIATGIPYDVETEHRRTDGTSYFSHIRGKANRDASGKTVSVTGTVQDISEREEARARLAALADNLPNGAIYRLEHMGDGQFTLTYISAGIFSFIGIQATEIIADQRLFLNAIHEEDLPRYQEALESSFATRDVFDCQFRAKTSVGEVRWMHSRSAPRYQADGTTVWDGIMRDITEERRAAEILEQAKDAAEAAEHAKSDFLATMSHADEHGTRHDAAGPTDRSCAEAEKLSRQDQHRGEYADLHHQ
jgi:PAS domain S-box-containing protein